MLDCTQNLTWPRYSNIINLYIKFHCKRCSLCEGNEQKLQIIGIFQSLMISITLSKVAQSNQKSNFQTWIMKDCPKIWFRSSDQISGGSSRLSRISTKIRHINSKWIHWDHKCWIFLPVNMTDMLALFLICWHYFIKDPLHPWLLLLMTGSHNMVILTHYDTVYVAKRWCLSLWCNLSLWRNGYCFDQPTHKSWVGIHQNFSQVCEGP